MESKKFHECLNDIKDKKCMICEHHLPSTRKSTMVIVDIMNGHHIENYIDLTLCIHCSRDEGVLYDIYFSNDSLHDNAFESFDEFVNYIDYLFLSKYKNMTVYIYDD